MAAITGITGAVTSWAGTQNTQLIATGSEPARFNLTIDADEFDTTTFATTGSETSLKGLRSVTGEITMQLKTAAIGNLGAVTFSAGYTTNLDEWELSVEGREFRSTAFADTAHAYIPGTYRWGGSFAGFLDGTTASTAPANSNEPATGTFKVREAGATDDTLSGSIFTTAANVSAGPLEANRVAYTFRGSGDLTQSTPSAGTTIFPTGAVAGATSGSLVLTASTGRSFTFDAFWTRVTVRVSVGDTTTVSIAFRGTGDVTIG